jgi:hypothetical protein
MRLSDKVNSYIESHAGSNGELIKKTLFFFINNLDQIEFILDEKKLQVKDSEDLSIYRHLANHLYLKYSIVGKKGVRLNAGIVRDMVQLARKEKYKFTPRFGVKPLNNITFSIFQDFDDSEDENEYVINSKVNLIRSGRKQFWFKEAV